MRESAVLAAPRTLITTLFSLPQPAQVTEFSIAQLIDLMADLGTDAAAVRSSVMRLKQKGFLITEKVGSRSIYKLSSEVREVFEDSDLRIFRRARAARDDCWNMVVFSIPESEREKRHALRTLLVRLGFGNVTSGVWISPRVVREEARRALHRAHLLSFVDMYEVKPESIDSPVRKVRAWWELASMESQFQSFIQRWRPLLARDLSKAPLEVKFRHYVLILTDWRKIAYLDPGISVAYLPSGWPGIDAENLFAEISDAIKEGAEIHLSARIKMMGANDTAA